jgi:hypothetical protein
MRSDEEERPPGLKPRLIAEDLRGPFGRLRAGSEGPHFHGDTESNIEFPTAFAVHKEVLLR